MSDSKNKCIAISKTGEKCKNPAIKGKSYCWIHTLMLKSKKGIWYKDPGFLSVRLAVISIILMFIFQFLCNKQDKLQEQITTFTRQ